MAFALGRWSAWLALGCTVIPRQLLGSPIESSGGGHDLCFSSCTRLLKLSPFGFWLCANWMHVGHVDGQEKMAKI